MLGILYKYMYFIIYYYIYNNMYIMYFKYLIVSYFIRKINYTIIKRENRYTYLFSHYLISEFIEVIIY